MRKRGWKTRAIRGRASLALYLMRPDAIDFRNLFLEELTDRIRPHAHGRRPFVHRELSRRWNVSHCTSCTCLAFKQLPDVFLSKVFLSSDYVSSRTVRRQIIFTSNWCHYFPDTKKYFFYSYTILEIRNYYLYCYRGIAFFFRKQFNHLVIEIHWILGCFEIRFISKWLSR